MSCSGPQAKIMIDLRGCARAQGRRCKHLCDELWGAKERAEAQRVLRQAGGLRTFELSLVEEDVVGGG